MIKLLKIGLEECTDCNKVNTNNESTGSSVTYDEGDGKKDLVVMTGPLSHIYTQALNLYFAKKDVNEPDVVKDNKEQSASIANESIQIDSVIQTGLMKHLEAQQTNPLIYYEIKPEREDIDRDPSVVVFSTSIAEANKPEVVDLADSFKSIFDESEKEFLMFVGPSTDGELKQQFVELTDQAESTDPYNLSETFKSSLESLYSSRGIKVVVGFENLVNVLLERSKSN